MMGQRRTPGMENGYGADASAQVLGIGRVRNQSLLSLRVSRPRYRLNRPPDRLQRVRCPLTGRRNKLASRKASTPEFFRIWRGDVSLPIQKYMRWIIGSILRAV